MKRLLLLMMFLAFPLSASALDVVPYTAQAFAQAQKAGQGFALFFHADWCPTCRQISKVFDAWKGKPDVPGTVMVVDYDTAKALERQMGVRSQAIVIFFKGKTEVKRLAFETDPDALRAALDSVR